MKFHNQLLIQLLSVSLYLQNFCVVGEDAPRLTTWAYLQLGDSTTNHIAGHNVSGIVRFYRQISLDKSTNCLCDSSNDGPSRWCYMGESSSDAAVSESTNVSIPERAQSLICTLYVVVRKSYLYCRASNNSETCSLISSPLLGYPNLSQPVLNTTSVCSLAYLSCYDKNCLTWCEESTGTSTSSTTSTDVIIEEDGKTGSGELSAVAVGLAIGGVVILVILISILACVCQHKKHKHHCHTFCKKHRFLHRRNHKEKCDSRNSQPIEENENNRDRSAQPLQHTPSRPRPVSETSTTTQEHTSDRCATANLSLNQSRPQTNENQVHDSEIPNNTEACKNTTNIDSCVETARITQGFTYSDYLNYCYTWYRYQQMYLKDFCSQPNLSSNFAHQTSCQQQQQQKLNESEPRFKPYDNQDAIAVPQDQKHYFKNPSLHYIAPWHPYFGRHHTANSHHFTTPRRPTDTFTDCSPAPLSFPFTLPSSSGPGHNLRNYDPLPLQQVNYFERSQPKQSNEPISIQPDDSFQYYHNNYHPHHHHNHVGSSGHRLYYPSDHLHDHQNQLHHLHHASHELLPDTNHHHNHHTNHHCYHQHQRRSLSSNDLRHCKLLSEPEKGGGGLQPISRTNSAESLSDAGIFFTATPQTMFYLGPTDGDAEDFEIKEEEEC